MPLLAFPRPEMASRGLGLKLKRLTRSLSQPAASRAYPTVGVAASIFPRCPVTKTWNLSRVCLIQRGKAPGIGLWCFPGGRLEWGERIAACAAREAAEETGLLVRPHNSSIPGYAATDSITPAADGRVEYHYGIVHVLTYCDATLDAAGHWGLPQLQHGDDAAHAAWIDTGLVSLHNSFRSPPGQLLTSLDAAGCLVPFVPEVIGQLPAFAAANQLLW